MPGEFLAGAAASSAAPAAAKGERTFLCASRDRDERHPL
jgi:hypothetical protein